MLCVLRFKSSSQAIELLKKIWEMLTELFLEIFNRKMKK